MINPETHSHFERNNTKKKRHMDTKRSHPGIHERERERDIFVEKGDRFAHLLLCFGVGKHSAPRSAPCR